MKTLDASIAVLAIISTFTIGTWGADTQTPHQNSSEAGAGNETANVRRPRIVHLTNQKDIVSTIEYENGNRKQENFHSQANDSTITILSESVVNNTNGVPQETYGITYIDKGVGVSTTSQRTAGVGYAVTQVAYNSIYNDGNNKYDSSRFKSTHRYANGVKVVIKGKGIDYFNGTSGGMSISKVIPPVQVTVEPVDPAFLDAGTNFTAKNVADQLNLATDNVFDFHERGSPSVIIKDSPDDLMAAAKEISEVMAQGPGAVDVQVFGDYKPDSGIAAALVPPQNKTKRLIELGNLILDVPGAHNPAQPTPSP